MLAFEGYEVDPAVLSAVAEERMAGVTLFRPLNVANAAQLRSLTAALQAAARSAGQLPLLIAADQEGGQLMALGEETTPFAGNMALGAVGAPDLAYRVGLAIGREAAALGVNINYAPNCDLTTNPANPACGIRSFGDQPGPAAALAGALTAGMQAAGVAATAKHFPGKGEAAVDSHYRMPVIAHSRERLEAVELAPFRAALNAGAQLVMTGHFAAPGLTGSADLPLTLSRVALTDLLRGDLGFRGVVITDAFDMGAITQGAGQIVDAIAALRAGVDLLLLTADRAVQERLAAGLELAWRRGLFEPEELRRSAERIAALRRWVGRLPQPPLEVVGSAAHRHLAQELAERSITLVRDRVGLLPLRLAADARIAVVMPRPANLTPADTSSSVAPGLADAVRRYHPRVDEWIVSHPPTAAETADLVARLPAYDLLILGTLSAHLDPAQAELARALLATGVPTVTVALRTPFDLTVYPQAAVHLCTYSILPPSLEALAAVLWGQRPAQGRLPVAPAEERA